MKMFRKHGAPRANSGADAEGLEDDVARVGEPDAALDRSHWMLVGCAAVDSPAPEAAAEEEDAVAGAEVRVEAVVAGIEDRGIDAARGDGASEPAGDPDKGAVEHATAGQVTDEPGDGLVNGALQQRRSAAAVSVHVETGERGKLIFDLDEASAVLHEAARHQEVAPEGAGTERLRGIGEVQPRHVARSRLAINGAIGWIHDHQGRMFIAE